MSTRVFWRVCPRSRQDEYNGFCHKSISRNLGSGLTLPYLQEYTLFLVSLISAQLKFFHPPIYNLIHQYPKEQKVKTKRIYHTTPCLRKWLHPS